MAFINEEDRETLHEEFGNLVQPIKLLLFEEERCEYCGDTKQVLKKIAALSDKAQLVDAHSCAIIAHQTASGKRLSPRLGSSKCALN